jgi:hypothetical protein
MLRMTAEMLRSKNTYSQHRLKKLGIIDYEAFILYKV